MIRTLFTSSSALRGHQELLDVVGNNLANINTTAFKGQRLRFGTQFSETLKAATVPGGGFGGTNPQQVGHGIRTVAIDTDFNQGNLETTGNALDLALEGDGFFVVNNGSQNFFTRAGAFSIDSQGFMVDSGSGMRVQRFGVVGEPDVSDPTQPSFQLSGNNDISIDFDSTIAGRTTTEVTFQGNLDADAVGPLREVVRINSALTEGGLAATGTTLLDNLDQTTAAYNAGDQIQITGTTVDGESVNAVFVALGGGVDTVQNLLDTINAAFGSGSPNGATASLDSNGFITVTADRAVAAELTMNLSSVDTLPSGTAAPTTGITNFNNFVTVTEGKEGDTTTTAIEIFDDQGAAHTLTFTFQKMGDNVWDLIAAIDPSGTFAGFDDRVDGITFNEDGSFQSVTGQDTQDVIATTLPLTVTATVPLAASTIAADDAVPGPATLLNDLDQTIGAYAGGPADDIIATGTRADGTTFTSRMSVFLGGSVGAATTMQDLVNFLNSAAVFDSGNLANPGAATASLVNGNVVVTADRPGPAQTMILSLSSDPASAAQTTFDNFTNTTIGQDGDDDITFEINNLAGFSTIQNIRFNLGTVGLFDGLTQFGGFTSAAATEQDGFSPGNLIDVAVDSLGVVQGTFSNGQTHSLAQLAVGTFSNNEGLFRAGSNLFRQDVNSGNAVIATAGAGNAGTIQGSVLENSNVDVTLEFTRLITAQRGFQANARSFTTADQVLQEAVNLKQ